MVCPGPMERSGRRGSSSPSLPARSQKERSADEPAVGDPSPHSVFVEAGVQAHARAVSPQVSRPT